ncbi:MULTISPECIES: SAM-dependent methyltransferase [Nocardioides]|uniref:SAM-dependent methyltransferase n=1 Tax=Nocardioides vastitatis TaxID=2568655 RepID=A0ABW0ZDE8_9ACTN|nr:class I SAM-dependent methyltransferase [Nocardioides sp.]THJ08618.1 methyltransferase domain-containing protein [Nocardioides sp.]
MSSITDVESQQAIEDLVGRIFMEGVGAFHLGTVYIGLKHGLFETLVERGPLTAEELSGSKGLDAWYVREWLQAEATAGLVVADDEDLTVARFTPAPAVREVLVEATGPAFIAGLPLATAAAYSVMPSLLKAFRTGEGVAYQSYGGDAVEAQAALNRPAFVNQLVAEWIPQIPDLAARLTDTTRTTMVADVGCGLGWAAIELAKAYPHLRIDGYDSDEESISRARRNAADHGVSDRLTFDVADASRGLGNERYDLILFLECVHDMAHPVEAMAAARAALADGGTVIVMDERVADTLTAGDPTETFFATVSVLWCLPQGRVEPDSEAVGTVMRTDRFRGIARDAGWSDVEVLPIDHPFWRFYRLLP